MKKIFTGLLGLLISLGACAQQLTGTLSNDQGEKLFGATLNWENTDIATVADETGYFSLPSLDTAAYLMINYVGYEAVAVLVEPHENNLDITIDGITDLMEVEVAAKVKDNYTSTLETRNVEVIGSGELRKAPCCSLAESFETNASVDVGYTDALTGAREIRLLGLRGVYTQMMVEKRPSTRGLASAFDMSYLPGTWLHSIQISKGAGSVQHGYQSITGQINSELVKPFEDDRFFINLYGSTFGRGEANIHLNKQLTNKWSAGLLLNGSTRHNSLDNNKDGFYDTPQKDMLDGMLRLFYRGDLLRAQFNVHAIKDETVGGQMPDADKNSDQLFRVLQNNERVELFGKMGYLGFDNPNSSFGLITSAAWHRLDGRYGRQWHRGTQRNFYLNGIYSSVIGSVDHKWNAGFSYLYDDYDEMLNETDFSRTERVPGAFFEYSYGHVKEPGAEESEESQGIWQKLGVVAGMRVDYHNMFGWLWTPRLNVKYNFSDNSVIRVAGGRGYRTANVIAENVGLLATSFRIVRTEELEMEDAWNMGVNFTQNFSLRGQDGSISLDAYRTHFNNQVIVDREHVTDEIWLYNLDGRSFANSILAVLSYELIPGIDIKMAYKLNDVRMEFLHGFHDMPMVARHQGLITVDLETPNEKWRLNTHFNLVGRQRFPYNYGVPFEYAREHYGSSPAFVTVGTQLTRRFGPLEVYAGVENLTGYTQDNPIIDWQNPFGEYFDASQIYAPITGAMGFVGLRYGIK
ncbi:MAG: carboxypeptidase-like regulatory domain-containing protein [Bacteroidota bacterium]